MSDQRDGGIAWCDQTWNPILGCSRVSAGCQHCYAEALAARFSGPGLAYEGLARRRSNGEPQWTGLVRVIEEHMLDPIRWRRPRRVFVNSMSDLFHESLPFTVVASIFAVMALAPRHTFQVLTKRPARMLEFFRWVEAEGTRLKDMPSHVPWDGTNVVTHHGCERFGGGAGFDAFHRALGHVEDEAPPVWPLENVWLGVSVEHQAAADERIPLLLQTPAAIRFLSCEPLLAPVDLRAVANPNGDYLHCLSNGFGFDDRVPRVDWVIVGGESGRGARPFDIGWARSIMTQCRVAGVPAFVKQLGARPCMTLTDQNPAGFWRIPLRDSHGGDMAEWPDDLRVREFPAARHE